MTSFIGESLEEKIARVMRGISIISHPSKAPPLAQTIAPVSEHVVDVGDNHVTPPTIPDAAEIMSTEMSDVQAPFETTNSNVDFEYGTEGTTVPIQSELMVTPPRLNRELVTTSTRKTVNLDPSVWSLSNVNSNIQIRNTVSVRICPLAQTEQSVDSRNIIAINNERLILVNPKIFEVEPQFVADAAFPLRLNSWAKNFSFDHVLSSVSCSRDDTDLVDQVGVYRSVGCAIVEHILSGISTIFFSYGHTGSGKTYTVFGDDFGRQLPLVDCTQLGLSDSSGLVPRVLSDIVEGLKLKDGCCDDTKISFSLLEIRNEKIRDLLDVRDDDKSADSLRIREHPSSGPYVEGLLKLDIQTSVEILNCFRHGMSRATLGSRTHTVVILELTPIFQDGEAEFAMRRSHKKSTLKLDKKDFASSCVRLYMVDLAAGESEPSAKVDPAPPTKVPTGHRKPGAFRQDNPDRLEMRLIRRSLSTLGYVIKAISKTPPLSGLPYRDSALTWLLKDTLTSQSFLSLLSTVSPSHKFYEDTLSTLKFSDQIHRIWNRNSLVVDDNAPADLDYSRLQGNLGADKPGSRAKKQLLKETISDPQQRLAKYAAIPGEVSSGQESLKIESKDIEELRNSYRYLQAQFVEMQIELDTARTDRDSYIIELRHARAALEGLEFGLRASNTADPELLPPKDSSKETGDLKAIISRKEDMIEKLLADLTDEKKKNIQLSQIQASQSSEYMAKIEKLQKDLLSTINELRAARKVAASQATEHEQFLSQIETLRFANDEGSRRLIQCQEELARSSDINQTLQREINSIKYAYNTIEVSLREQTLEMDNQRARIDIITKERDALLAASKQHKTLLELQSQQSEEVLRLQWQRQAALERIEKDADYTVSQLMAIQDGLQKLFAREGTLLHSELVDAKKLTSMLTVVRERLREGNAVRFELDKERAIRLQMQNDHMSDKVKLAAEEESNEVLEQLSKYRKIAEANEAKANYWQSVAQRVKSIAPNSPQSFADPVLAIDPSRDLQIENNNLRAQLSTALADVALAHATLEKSQESMQKEFSSLWLAVQELNKLDAAKEKALAELISDRDKAIVDKNNATSCLQELALKYNQLQQDLEAVDRDLLEAAEAEQIDVPSSILHSHTKQATNSGSTMPTLADSNHLRFRKGQYIAPPTSPLIETVVQNQIVELAGFLHDDRARHSNQQRRAKERSMQVGVGSVR